MGSEVYSNKVCFMGTAEEEYSMIKSVDHTSFTVSDVERTISFYRDLLGMELISLAERDPAFSEKVTGIPGAHLKIAYLRAPGGHHLELIEYLSPPGTRLDTRTHNVGSAHLAFRTDDLPKMYADLKAAGVPFKSPPMEVPAGPNKGNLAVYCSDPDGITLEFIQVRKS
jgi:catechol 2,3-dioxygenase-like lactoylglutathione lyase family enzyme